MNKNIYYIIMLSNQEIKKRLLGGCYECDIGGKGSKIGATKNPYIQFLKARKDGSFQGNYSDYNKDYNKKIVKKKVRRSKNVIIKNYVNCPKNQAERIIQEESENRPALPKEMIQIRAPPPPPELTQLTEEEKEAQRERARLSRENRNLEEKQQTDKGLDTNLMDELKQAVEKRRLKKLEGSGFRAIKEHRGSIRDLFIKKYTNIENYNPEKDTYLNRYIRDYVNQTETQQFLNKITEQQIEKENYEIQEPSTINYVPPPPPLQATYNMPIGIPQLVPQTIPRPQLNLLEEIRQGKKLKSKTEVEVKLEEIQKDLGETELIKLGQNIDPEEIAQFEKIIDTVDVEALKVEIGKNLIENTTNAPMSMLDQIKQGFKLKKVVVNKDFKDEEKDALKEALNNIRAQVQEEDDDNEEWSGEGFRILGSGFSRGYINRKYIGGYTDFNTQGRKAKVMALERARNFYGF